MLDSLFDRLPASHFGMPDRPSRRWILEHANLAGRIMTKTPEDVDVPIPDNKAGTLFTHALYVVDCDHDDPCRCSDDDAVPWIFVEYFNIDGNIWSLPAPVIRKADVKRYLGVEE